MGFPVHVAFNAGIVSLMALLMNSLPLSLTIIL
jgi:hypothetical protein